MVSMRSEEPICASPHLSEVSPTSLLKRFQCPSDWRWPSLVFSRKIISHFRCPHLSPPHLSPPGDQWCDVLGFVPAGSVSSSSTLQIFCEASHLWGLLCLSVYLLGHFPSLRHVQGSTPTGVLQEVTWITAHFMRNLYRLVFSLQLSEKLWSFIRIIGLYLI